MGTRVDQLLHGYRQGHERIAGSLSLPIADADAVGRLSDLSGTLTGSSVFAPYLTAYPLPSGKYYAIARTWPDKLTRRAGCVLTHTLLVPRKVWAEAKYPSSIEALFRDPSHSDVESFSVAMEWEPGAPPMTSHSVDIDTCLEFVQRFFGDGRRPVVWFGNASPVDSTLCLLDGLWPALRESVAICTYCLQPRWLEDQQFDVMFAPDDAYPRFVKFPEENVVGTSRNRQLRNTESWVEDWAARVFGVAPPMDGVAAQLWNSLDSDPATIKRVYLIERGGESGSGEPFEAVGAMDLLESVSRLPSEALEFKARVAMKAVLAAKACPNAARALESLKLVEERLRRESYAHVAGQVGAAIQEAVADIVTADPGAIQLASPNVVAVDEFDSSSWFTRGLVVGFQRVATRAPMQLLHLRTFPTLRESLLEGNPEVAVAFGVALFVSRGAADDSSEFIAWLRNPIARRVRSELIREVLARAGTSDGDVLSELLAGCPISALPAALSGLKRIYGDLTAAASPARALFGLYPLECRGWLVRGENWAVESGGLLASTFGQTPQSMTAILDTDELTLEQRAWALASLVCSDEQARQLPWVRELLASDPRVINSLLAAAAAGDDRIGESLRWIAREYRGVRAAVDQEAVFHLLAIADGLYYEAAVRLCAWQIFVSYVGGGIDEKDLLPHVRSKAAEAWLSEQDSWTLVSLLTHDVAGKPANWLRAWRLLVHVPDSVYKGGASAIVGAVERLQREGRSHWSSDAVDYWRGVLSRARAGSDGSVSLTLRAQALTFAFDHLQWPVSKLVVDSYRDVYEAVVAARALRPEPAFFFSFFDWDRAKELRRVLVSSYLNSAWPPGDLVLAVREPVLLRKIIKRIQRESGARVFLDSALADLQKRGDESGREAHAMLKGVLDAGDYVEDWD